MVIIRSGLQAAGWLGALVVTLAFFLPSSIVVYVAARFWNRWRGSAWHSAIEDGFVPIAAGLVLAGAFAILQSRACSSIDALRRVPVQTQRKLYIRTG
jgi:chromate transporter